MKYFSLIVLTHLLLFSELMGQENEPARKDIYELIDQYSEARDNKDTVLLKRILTGEVDQLVSSGIWRTGIGEAVEGMMQSSESNPGDRTLTIEKIRFIEPAVGIVDARYEIENPDGTNRKMWSTFIVALKDGKWKITGIRNMLPSSKN